VSAIRDLQTHIDPGRQTVELTGWIGDTMTTEDQPYLQMVAVLRGAPR
jgi:hypothetical protein